MDKIPVSIIFYPRHNLQTWIRDPLVRHVYYRLQCVDSGSAKNISDSEPDDRLWTIHLETFVRSSEEIRKDGFWFPGDLGVVVHSVKITDNCSRDDCKGVSAYNKKKYKLKNMGENGGLFSISKFCQRPADFIKLTIDRNIKYSSEEVIVEL